jgi:hypothetical protein
MPVLRGPVLLGADCRGVGPVERHTEEAAAFAEFAASLGPGT